MNTWKRRAPAILAVALLSVPSAVGVYHALAPTRGWFAAGSAAAGFEAVYLSTAVLVLTPALRTYAQRVALAAVGVAVVLNTLADYQARVPGGLASWAEAVRLFDPLAAVLAVVESAPLAILAYAVAMLIHRLSEGAEPERTEAAPPAQDARTDAPAPAWACVKCGEPVASAAHRSASGKWGCEACKRRAA